jgi:uncharacterized protein DUF6429
VASFKDHGLTRAWKGIDWEISDRLHERGLIEDPKNKSKSLVFSAVGLEVGRAAAAKLFGSDQQ